MTEDKFESATHFSNVAASYELHRPSYPAQLISYLAGLTPAQNLALDIGCGSGQLTKQLGEHFNQTLGSDLSSAQLAQTEYKPAIHYFCSPAEVIPVKNGIVDLVVAAQAAHWFVLNDFYDEVRRISKKKAVLALISYGVMSVDHVQIQQRFQTFYQREISPYWPGQRRHVDTEYRLLDFPFKELENCPAFQIERDWDLNNFMAYIHTWSAVHQALQQEGNTLISDFEQDISLLWNNPKQTLKITWPIAMRVGYINE